MKKIATLALILSAFAMPAKGQDTGADRVQAQAERCVSMAPGQGDASVTVRVVMGMPVAAGDGVGNKGAVDSLVRGVRRCAPYVGVGDGDYTLSFAGTDAPATDFNDPFQSLAK